MGRKVIKSHGLEKGCVIPVQHPLINMKTGAQTGEDMSKVMSFTFNLFNHQSTGVGPFLGTALCSVLSGRGGKGIVRRRKQTPFLASKNLCSNWDPQLTSTPSLPGGAALSLATSLHVSQVVSVLRTQVKPGTIHLPAHKASHFIPSRDLHGRNLCSLKFFNEKSEVQTK